MIPETYLFYGILYFTWLEFLWKQYLTLRQRRVYKTTERTNIKLTDVIDEETFNISKTISIAKITLGMVKDWLNIIVFTTFICLDGYTSVWNFSKSFLDNTPYRENEMAISCMFTIVINAVTMAMLLVFSAYDILMIENKYGYSTKTFGAFVTDSAICLLSSQSANVVPFATMAVSEVSGGWWSLIWLWAFTALVQSCVSAVYQSFVSPSIERLTPLPDGPLKTKTQELAQSVGFHLSEVYVNGGVSCLSKHVYWFGLLKNKRIVLFDMLLKDTRSQRTRVNLRPMSDDEVVAIICHELGHWKLKHAIFEKTLFQVDQLIKSLAFGWLYDNPMVNRTFGFHEQGPPMAVGLAIMDQYVLRPYMMVSSYVQAVFNRELERRADEFVNGLGRAKALRTALIKLNNDRLLFPVEDSMYATWYDYRPRLLDRLESLKSKDD